MTNYRLVAPAIRWGTNLANAVYFPFPLDSVFSGEDPRAGSSFIQAPSGFEDSWYVGTDYTLAGLARWLQQADTLLYPRCTGWDGTLGIRAALNYLRQKNTFSWHPDGRNLLRLPLLNNAGALSLAGVGGWATSNNGGMTAAFSFDAVETAWKLVGSNPTGVSGWIQLNQAVPSIPGEILTPSVDYKVTALAGGAEMNLGLDAQSAIAYISTPYYLTGLTSTVYARAGGGVSTAFPAGTVTCNCILRLLLPAGASGTIWFKNAMLRRDSTVTTFIDNPSIDGCYLVDPMDFAPLWETDGSRQLALKIRNPSAPFDGY